MLPCPWCVLNVRHGAPVEHIEQAVQYCHGRAQARQMTVLQHGMTRHAAAQIFLSLGVAETPSQALQRVEGMEGEIFNLWGQPAAKLFCTGALPPPPPPAPPQAAQPSRRSASRRRGASKAATLVRLNSPRGSAAAKAGRSLSASSSDAQPPCRQPSWSAASRATGAWLAPPSGHSIFCPLVLPPQSEDLALVPYGAAAAAASAAAPAAAPEVAAQYWWQVKTGKPQKRKWSYVAEDLNGVLEHAHQNNLDSCLWSWNGASYYYDMNAGIQVSPNEHSTERPIRRVARPAEWDSQG